MASALPRRERPRSERGGFALSAFLHVVSGIALSVAFVGLLEGGRARWLGLFLVICFALLFARALAVGAEAASASLESLIARLDATLERLPEGVRAEVSAEMRPLIEAEGRGRGRRRLFGGW
jgi:uncharacterized membrane protein YedE/YeeE